MAEKAPGLARGDVVALRRGVRIQFEQAQNSWVLLYPEGMVQLGDTAAEIMKRIDGVRDIAEIIRDLDEAYSADTGADVIEFLETAHERRWIERNGR